MAEVRKGLSKSLAAALRCPVCKAPLDRRSEEFACRNGACSATFPIVGGIPILLNEAHSIFSIDDYLLGRTTYVRKESRLRRVAKRVLPALSSNVRSAPNIAKLVELARRNSDSPRVLVIGGGILGVGMASLDSARDIELIETDVSLAPRTQIVCDAHDLPFQDASFDAVVAQAVLEHVVDPYRCVEEIYRVLANSGLVYAETPFMQQVHGGKYDFTRFTSLGHRRLFRRFELIDSGAVGGPAIALAWAYRYFLLSLVTRPTTRALMEGFARLTAFWVKYLDPFLLNRPGSLDASSVYYFLGRKSDQTLPDRELINLYRGE
jgi:SAM-dependent methyltransferase